LRHRRPRPVQGTADARLRRRRQGPEDVEVEGQRHRAAEDFRHARRRNPAPVGRRHRLLGELSISDEILKRVVEAYRRIRNTLRFLLANTADFDAAKDMLPVDRMAGNRPLRAGHDAPMQQAAEADYGRYEFHRVVQALQTFCSEDLGGFYLDILKDRLYTTSADSTARRSAQSALWHITAELREADGADSLLYRRRGLAAIERRRRAVGDAPNLAAAAASRTVIGDCSPSGRRFAMCAAK
jgi:hypothetical protein